MHQIFSDSRYIFKVSSTLGKLYRYRFNPDLGEIDEIAVFKRVRQGEREMVGLKQIGYKRKTGTATLFEGNRYDVYVLQSDKYFRGYMLYARNCCEGSSTPKRIYFAYEKREKKGS